ncbi:MAG TPA: hypothetical protein VKB46_12320 [Pyrinomonadaceae bacterium]|nr:hypothetical protein [Pyrinomonadaceae bacterium]
MNKISALLVFACLILVLVSCRLANTLTGNDQNLKKIGDLWNDVPRMDGLTTSEAEMPLFVKVMMRTALNNLYRLNKEGEAKTPATGDWAVFSTTKSPQDVQNFYTNERMTSFGNWEPSKNSTCLNGSEYHFSGVACVFQKTANNAGIGLMIIAAQDEEKKQTNVFFVRTETPLEKGANPPTNTTNGPPTPRGEIKPLSGSAPYGIEKRPLPNSLNLDELLPKQVGPYSRTLLEKSDQRGVTPTTIEVDGNSVYATYMAGGREVFVEFGVNSSADNAQSTLDTAAGEVTGKFPTDPRFGSLGTEPSYLKVDNESGAFFAWTRGKYYWSANAKGGAADLDAFMQAFPY